MFLVKFNQQLRMTNDNIIKGSLAIGIAAILWGLDGVVLTPRLYNLPVEFVVFVLHALPFLVMNIFLYKQYSYLKVFTSKDVVVLLLVALLGGSIGTIAIVKALFLVNFQELSVVVLLQKLQPLFAISLAALLLKEKLTKNFGLWAVVATLAGYTLAFGFHLPNLEADSNSVLAALYAILAAISFGGSTVFGKKALAKYSFKTITFYRYGFASIMMLVWILVLGQINQFQFVTQQNALFFVIISLTTGSGAIFLYYIGLNNVKAIVSTMVELLYPISSVLFDYWINGTILSPVQWASAIVMIAAIINLNRSQSRLTSQLLYQKAMSAMRKKG
jgi:drug/metabolite transporter (DMT)-like permease